MTISQTAWRFFDVLCQSGGRGHHRFLKFQNFDSHLGQEGQVTIPNFLAISQKVAEMAIFQNGGCRRFGFL